LILFNNKYQLILISWFNIVLSAFANNWSISTVVCPLPDETGTGGTTAIG
jgi:hypothetical protein